jgi:hypothetical protein
MTWTWLECRTSQSRVHNLVRSAYLAHGVHKWRGKSRRVPERHSALALALGLLHCEGVQLGQCQGLLDENEFVVPQGQDGVCCVVNVGAGNNDCLDIGRRAELFGVVCRLDLVPQSRRIMAERCRRIVGEVYDLEPVARSRQDRNVHCLGNLLPAADNAHTDDLIGRGHLGDSRAAALKSTGSRARARAQAMPSSQVFLRKKRPWRRSGQIKSPRAVCPLRGSVQASSSVTLQVVIMVREYWLVIALSWPSFAIEHVRIASPAHRQLHSDGEAGLLIGRVSALSFLMVSHN